MWTERCGAWLSRSEVDRLCSFASAVLNGWFCGHCLCDFVPHNCWRSKLHWRAPNYVDSYCSVVAAVFSVLTGRSAWDKQFTGNPPPPPPPPPPINCMRYLRLSSSQSEVPCAILVGTSPQSPQHVLQFCPLFRETRTAAVAPWGNAARTAVGQHGGPSEDQTTLIQTIEMTILKERRILGFLTPGQPWRHTSGRNILKAKPCSNVDEEEETDVESKKMWDTSWVPPKIVSLVS